MRRPHDLSDVPLFRAVAEEYREALFKLEHRRITAVFRRQTGTEINHVLARRVVSRHGRGGLSVALLGEGPQVFGDLARRLRVNGRTNENRVGIGIHHAVPFGLHGGDDALDVLPGPCRDGGTQISMRETVKAAGEDPVEGIHQNFHSVLHGVVEGLRRGVA